MPASDPIPNITMKRLAFPGRTNCVAAPMAPMSAPKLKMLAAETTKSTL